MKQTPLYQKHEEAGAKMIEFSGWKMPLYFSSVMKEHMSVREKVGMFDVSHMGSLFLKGEGALEFISKHCTMNITTSNDYQLKYAHILNEKGGIIDDTIITRLKNESCYLVPNAGKTGLVKNWLEKRGGEEYIHDISDDTIIIALQGPEADRALSEISDSELPNLDFFTADTIHINDDIMEFFDGKWPMADAPIVQKSGYTGEDGYEIIIPKESGKVLWDQLLSIEDPPMPCGLGARDSLRIEFGFLLSGQDFDESRTTIEVGWEKQAIDWDNDFLGKDELKKMKDKDHQVLKGLLMMDRGIPRHGYKVFVDDDEISVVTSGARSPVLKKGIALAYLDPGYHEEGTEVHIEIRGDKRLAEVKNPPFV